MNVFLWNNCVVDVKRMSDSLIELQSIFSGRWFVVQSGSSDDFCVTNQKE